MTPENSGSKSFETVIDEDGEAFGSVEGAETSALPETAPEVKSEEKPKRKRRRRSKSADVDTPITDDDDDVEAEEAPEVTPEVTKKVRLSPKTLAEQKRGAEILGSRYPVHHLSDEPENEPIPTDRTRVPDFK